MGVETHTKTQLQQQHTHKSRRERRPENGAKKSRPSGNRTPDFTACFRFFRDLHGIGRKQDKKTGHRPENGFTQFLPVLAVSCF